jgi:hypothetical protein
MRMSKKLRFLMLYIFLLLPAFLPFLRDAEIKWGKSERKTIGKEKRHEIYEHNPTGIN